MKSTDKKSAPEGDESRSLRDPILLREETEEDAVLNLSLRPRTFADFIGQRQIADNVKIAIAAARARGDALEHLILSGPPGLGKTTLAHIIAHEMGTKITTTSGPAIERAGDLIGILTNLEQGDVLFIDEIHRLSKVVEEFLYPAMEDFKIDFIIDKGPYAKTINFNLKPFTLIGATTRSGLLTAPLRSRFGMHFHIDFYPTDDLVRIIDASAVSLGVNPDSASSQAIACRARGTPRVANRLLRRVRDLVQIKGNGVCTQELVEEALRMQGIDAMGLDEVDRKVLRVIIDTYDGGPVGIESLAATLNEESDTIVDVVEPYLLKIGMLKRSSRGRLATAAAYHHLGKPLPHAGPEGKELFS